MQEEELGYQGHGWLAIGELCHAELEVIRLSPSIAEAIRATRLQYIEYLNSKNRDLAMVPDVLPLIMMVTALHDIEAAKLEEGTVSLFEQPET